MDAETKGLIIKNYLEDLVLEHVKLVIEAFDYCTCERCINDITAIALNELPPKYVVTHEGEVYTKIEMLEQEYKVQLITAVTKAAERVNQAPRHAKK